MVGLGLPLAGCFIPNEKIPAAIDMPQAYRAGPRNPDAALPSTVWWRGFGSKELTDLIEESLTSNFDVAAAVARIVQADANSRIAGAALLPVVDLNASTQRSSSSLNAGNGNFNASSSGIGSSRLGRTYSNLYSASLSASYEIDFWGKNRAALRAAEEHAVASRFDREVVALTTVVAVANSYFLVLEANDRLRIARDNLAAATRVYNLIKQRFDVGTASALDTAQQESLVATQRASIPPLEQALRQNIATLALLIGRTPETVTVRGGSMARLRIPPVTPGLPSDLIAQRPDIREAEAQLAAANANVYSARAAFLPSIQLTGEGGFQSAVLKTLLKPESAIYNVAAGLTQPILDGARSAGPARPAGRRAGRVAAALPQVHRQRLYRCGAGADRGAATARHERLQRDVVTSSRRAFDISETRLREGTIDMVTLLNTQQTLFQAQDVLAQAQSTGCRRWSGCSRRWAAAGRNPRKQGLPRGLEDPPNP